MDKNLIFKWYCTFLQIVSGVYNNILIIIIFFIFDRFSGKWQLKIFSYHSINLNLWKYMHDKKKKKVKWVIVLKWKSDWRQKNFVVIAPHVYIFVAKVGDSWVIHFLKWKIWQTCWYAGLYRKMLKITLLQKMSRKISRRSWKN